MTDAIGIFVTGVFLLGVLVGVTVTVKINAWLGNPGVASFVDNFRKWFA